MKVIAQLISWCFLPIFMPFYGLLIALYVPSVQVHFFDQDSLYTLVDELKSAIIYMFFVLAVMAPAVSFLLLHRFGVISTLDMENRKERLIPMLLLLIYGILLYTLLLVKSGNLLPKYVYALPFSGICVTTCFIFINRIIKVSSHAGGAGIMCGFLMAYLCAQQSYIFWIVPIMVLLSGLIMSSRLYLNKHVPKEVYTGWIVAFVLTLSICYFYP
jgi:membrane-associated phospholipid phosphatase